MVEIQRQRGMRYGIDEQGGGGNVETRTKVHRCGLRHLDRTRLLLHLITVSGEEGRSPLADYHAIRKELKAYSPELARRPEVVALAKADLPDVHELYDELKVEFEKLGVDLLLVSAATHQGLDEVVQYLAERLFL